MYFFFHLSWIIHNLHFILSDNLNLLFQHTNCPRGHKKYLSSVCICVCVCVCVCVYLCMYVSNSSHQSKKMSIFVFLCTFKIHDLSCHFVNKIIQLTIFKKLRCPDVCSCLKEDPSSHSYDGRHHLNVTERQLERQTIITDSTFI